MMTIQPTQTQHIVGLQDVLRATGLFPAAMLPELLERAQLEDALWLTCSTQEQAVGFCYAVPEDLTDGTWNMRAIAVHPAHQGKDFGKALISSLETALHEKGARLLIVDTSGTPAFADTHAFYRATGYRDEARIRDYWAPGDDKLIFTKSLGGG